MNNANNYLSKNKRANYALFVFALLIFSYTLIRATLLSFTWDEAFSYLQFVRNGVVIPEKYEMMSANNHLLNTWLNIHLVKIFGLSEFVLRLPSLFAHILFLFFSYKLIKNFENKWLAIASFLIINLNPYLLDFFSLSRGYGLSIGLTMTSIYYLYAFHIKEFKTKYAVLSLVFGLLASLANFTALNYFLVSFGLIMLLTMTNSFRPGKTFMDKSLLFLSSAFLPALIFLLSMLFLVPITLKLKEAGALFYGGTKGFCTDTFCTITDRCFYELGYNYWFQRATKGFVILVVLATGLFLIRKSIKKQMDTNRLFLFSLLFILCVCSLSTIVQHYVFGTLYLMDRTALFLVVLFSLLLVFFIHEVSKEKKQASVVVYFVGIFALIHFALALNLSYVLEWKWDADIKQMITDLDKIKVIPEGKTNISICIPLEFDQGINFYRAKDSRAWINTVERSDISDMRYDYYFLGPEECAKRNMDSLEIIKTYPHTNNVLAKPKCPAKSKVCFANEFDFEHSSEKEYLIDEKTEYSKDFDYVLNDSILMNKRAEVVFTADVKSEEISKNNLYIVISFENEKGLFQWERACLKDYIIKAGEWTSVSFSSLVPKETKAGDRLKSYIWNPDKHRLIVKKMEFKWLSKP